MIQPASIYRHIHEGYDVIIADIGEHPRVKDANDASWQPAVAYIRDGSVFIRSQADFLAKFALRDTVEEQGA